MAIVAGADTTASALTSLFACLLSRPDAYARLQEEVDMLYPRGVDPLAPGPNKETGPFLTAVM